MYGLSQAGRITYDDLVERLLPHGYFPALYTSGLWLHKTRPISFTPLTFGTKYTSLGDASHLIAALKERYEVAENWTGSLYTGMTH